MKKLLLLFFFPLLIWAQVCEERCMDECEFEHAQQMFNPWYSGPLLTGSAHMMKPGWIGIQPYIFAIVNYGRFGRDRHSFEIHPHLVNYKPVINAIQAGIFSWLDVSLALQSEINTQRDRRAGGFGDTILTLGFKILEETACQPAIKVGIGEIFPTGKYQRLSSGKRSIGAVGQGSYQTTFSLRMSKIFLRSCDYPLNVRGTIEYVIPTTTHVHGFNAYGGGFGTAGKVHPGNQLNVTFGMEFCFYEKCVLVADLVYITNNHSPFHGTTGTNFAGAPATVGFHSNDQLSLAPVLEYNFSRDFGVLGGMWFSWYGRNSFNFLGPIFGLNYTFPISS